MSGIAKLPVVEVLDDLRRALGGATSAVLVAPPGAGKTTGVPPALLDEPWLTGKKILLLEPRRIAARAAAERMAETLGERVGETVGIRARLDTRVGPRTRVEVVTEGVFTRLILDDPSLEGVGLVIFDEFHERSLDADLGLALALDACSGLRGDLRILVMSATLDGARVATLLGDAPVIRSDGRAYPVATRHLGRPPERSSLADAVAVAVKRALSEETGSVLAFLPGQGEIRRAAERLRQDVGDATVDIVELHGGLMAQAQREAIRPAASGRRKVVLATAIAQTSITIEGVRVVVDCGLERLPRYEPAAGVTRLETVRASRATVDQRRGRAGRTEPGVCYRLWSEPETQGLLPFTAPEILSADLSPLLLDCLAWGVTEPATLAWLDAPPTGALAAAKSELQSLGALDAQGQLTARGRQLRDLPLAPRLAAMIVAATATKAEGEAAMIAAVLSERGIGGPSTDLDDRLQGLRRDRGPRAESLRSMATGWARAARNSSGSQTSGAASLSTAALLALAFPDRIAKARGPRGTFLLANGRAAVADPATSLADAAFLVVAEMSGMAAGARILLAARLDASDLEEIAGPRIEARVETVFDPAAAALRTRAERRLGAIVLASEPRPVPPDEAAARSLADGVAALGLDRLPWTRAQRQLIDRVAFLRAAERSQPPSLERGQPPGPSAAEESRRSGQGSDPKLPSPERCQTPSPVVRDPAPGGGRVSDTGAWPDLTNTALAATTAVWLQPFIVGATRLADITSEMLANALDTLLPWSLKQRLDADAPTHFTAPTGNRHAIDYEGEGAPIVALRVQELYGLKTHPAIAGGRLPLTLHLLSPAHRPVQITRDLPGFWAGSWRDVKTDMKGRYPRHLWPDDPANAAPTARAKPRGT